MNNELYSAVVQWLHLFPAFQANPLYIFGESYGAKYAIQLAKKIGGENADLKLTTSFLNKVI